MARTELFDLFFHPVFQKCLKHAESCATNEGMSRKRLSVLAIKVNICRFRDDDTICVSINYHLRANNNIFEVIVSFEKESCWLSFVALFLSIITSDDV